MPALVMQLMNSKLNQTSPHKVDKLETRRNFKKGQSLVELQRYKF